MKVGNLVTARSKSFGAVGTNKTGEFIKIKPNAPPQIVTKLIQIKDCKLLEVEIYLPWRNEKCIVNLRDVKVFSEV